MKWEDWTKKDIRKVIKNFNMDISSFVVPVKGRGRYKSNEALYRQFNKLYPGLCKQLSEFHFFIINKDIPGFVDFLFCATCGKRLTVKQIKGNAGPSNHKYCSRKCSAVSELTVQTRVETVRKTYGVDNVSQNKEVNRKVKKFWRQVRESGELETILSKARSTNLKRYGTPFVTCNEAVKDKSRATCLERYGVPYFSQTEKARLNFSENNPQYHPSVKRKSRKTCLLRYGVPYASQSEAVQQKIKATLRLRYGVDNISQNEEIKEKVKQSMRQHFGVDHNFQSEEVKARIRQTNIERYGVPNVMQNNEIRVKNENSKLANNSWTSSIPETMAYLILAQYFKDIKRQYSDDRYPYRCDLYVADTDTFIEINGWFHGEEPYDKDNVSHRTQLLELRSAGEGTRNCSRAYTWSISDVKKRRRAKRLSLNYLEIFVYGKTDLNYLKQWARQQKSKIYQKRLSNARNSVRKYIQSLGYTCRVDAVHKPTGLTVDLLVPSKKLAIIIYDPCLSAYDGSQVEDSQAFKQKVDVLDTIGYNHLIVSTWDWHDNRDLWRSIIGNRLGLSRRVAARKCCIKPVDTLSVRNFLVANHLQGYCSSSCNLGLYYEDELVSVMTFGKSRFTKDHDWELLRYCNKAGTTVVGGASKLFTAFLRQYPNVVSVISYANRNWSRGNLYETLGFNRISVSAPNYKYFKANKRVMFNRIQFQKHKLQAKLEVFNHNLSEVQNMYNNGYLRVFDSGNIKYVWAANGSTL